MTDFAASNEVAELAEAIGHDMAVLRSDLASAVGRREFNTRAAAADANVPPVVSVIAVEGRAFVRDPSGTALATADGGRWSPLDGARLSDWGWLPGAPNQAAILSAAILSANRDLNRPLDMPEGAVVTLTENLPTFTFPVRLRSNPERPCLIEWTNATGIGLRVEGVPVAAPTTHPNDIDAGAYSIPVTSAAAVQPGDLMLLSSNKLWITAPPEQNIRYGELTVVQTVSGNTVTVADAFNNGYIVSIGAAITFYRPLIGVSFVGINFKKPAGTNECVRVSYAISPVARDCAILAAGNNGIRFTYCYTPIAERVATQRVRTAPAYALSDYGCVRAVFRDCTGMDNNKTVDISGQRCPSRDALIINCHDRVSLVGSGSGIGFGSHWAAERTRFIGNTSQGRTYGINGRGVKEVIEGNVFYGRFDDAVIYLEDPRGTVIRANVYTGPVDGTATGAPPSFLKVIAPTKSSTSFSLIDNDARGINRRLVYLDDSDVQWRDIDIMSNRVRIANVSTGNAIALIETSDTSGSISGLTESDNTLIADSGQTNVLRLSAAAFDLLIRTGGQRMTLAPANTTYVNVQSDTAEVLFLGTAGNCVEISIRVEGLEDFYCRGLLFKSGNLVAFGAALNVVGVSGFMTGTTGGTATAGKIAVSLRDARLYVQNRTGAARKVYITTAAVA